MKYSTTYPITASNIDERYRLSIDGLLTFHENTVARYMTLLNLAAFDIQKTDRTWVISEINLELPTPPSIWSEDIRITLWLSEMSSLRVWFDFIAEEVHSGKIAAKGNSCWSLISMSERRLIPCGGLIPESMLVNELSIGPHRKRNADKVSPDIFSSIEHRVNPLDLDFNGHMNNRRYVSMALLSFGQSTLSLKRPDRLGIRFLKEARLGDTLSAKTFAMEESDSFVSKITLEGTSEEICRVTSHWIPKEEVPDIADVNYVRNPR